MLDDVVADQRQLAAQAADRADRDGRRAGRVGQHDLAGGEDDAGVAAERLADRRQRQAEPGRTRVLVRQAADLQFGNAQVPRIDAAVAAAEPQLGAPRGDEAGRRLAHRLADAVEAEIEQLGDLRHQLGRMRLGGEIAGDRFEQLRAFAVRADQGHEDASGHGWASSSSISSRENSARVSASASSTTCRRPSRSNTPSICSASPRRTLTPRSA